MDTNTNNRLINMIPNMVNNYLQLLNCTHKEHPYYPLLFDCAVCEFNDMCIHYKFYKTLMDIYIANKDCDTGDWQEFRNYVEEKYHEHQIYFDEACPEYQGYLELDYEDYISNSAPTCETCPSAEDCYIAKGILVHKYLLGMKEYFEDRKYYDDKIKIVLEEKDFRRRHAKQMYYIKGMEHWEEDYYKLRNKIGKVVFILNAKTGEFIDNSDIRAENENNYSDSYNNDRNELSELWLNDIDKEYVESVLDDSNDYYK